MEGSIVPPKTTAPGSVLDCDDAVVPALRFNREERVGIDACANENRCHIWSMQLMP
jgi:hypothetical protein